jgi:hypothetical protein
LDTKNDKFAYNTVDNCLAGVTETKDLGIFIDSTVICDKQIRPGLISVLLIFSALSNFVFLIYCLEHLKSMSDRYLNIAALFARLSVNLKKIEAVHRRFTK